MDAGNGSCGILSCIIPRAGAAVQYSLPRNLGGVQDQNRSPQGLEVVLAAWTMRWKAQKWAVSNKMPWRSSLFGYLDNLSGESPLIRKNYPGPIPSWCWWTPTGTKIASGSMDGLVREGGGAVSGAERKRPNPVKRTSLAWISAARFFPHPDTANSPKG